MEAMSTIDVLCDSNVRVSKDRPSENRCIEVSLPGHGPAEICLNQNGRSQKCAGHLRAAKIAPREIRLQ